MPVVTLVKCVIQCILIVLLLFVDKVFFNEEFSQIFLPHHQMIVLIVFIYFLLVNDKLFFKELMVGFKTIEF